MPAVTVYTKPLCPYCVRAMMLLKKKGVVVTEVCAAFDTAKRDEMVKRANGRTTYPQIFVGEVHVGGCDELFALEQAGKLDGLLNAA